MRLLVTNDDGIESVFLHELVRALIAADHQVFVAAPAVEQSWTGASKTRQRAIRSCTLEKGLGCPTWSVDGTPSDCVNIAIEHLVDFEPQAVVSGINVGRNDGLGFILGSGTVAGACEGALHGLPAVALSQSIPPELYETVKARGADLEPAFLELLRTSARHAARLVPELVGGMPSRTFVVHNVNFPHPCTASSEVRRTVPARVLLPALFSPRDEDGTHRLVFRPGDDHSPITPMTDRAALDAGYISHTVLDFSKLGSI